MVQKRKTVASRRGFFGILGGIAAARQIKPEAPVQTVRFAQVAQTHMNSYCTGLGLDQVIKKYGMALKQVATPHGTFLIQEKKVDNGGS